MIRVGFVIDFTAQDWTGGINYYGNLLNALYSLPDRKIEPVIFTGLKADLSLFKDFPSVEIIRTGLLDKSGIIVLMRHLCRLIFVKEWFLEQLLIKNNISLLSHYGFLSSNAKIPTIGWIPDFQHRHLPEFFSEKEVKSRERYFKHICRLCSCVLVSSYSAQKDLEGFDPGCLSKSRVLQFVVGFNGSVKTVALEELEKRYGFNGPFFYLPNQFWAHKNHRVVLEAVHLLKTTGRKVQVLATGNPNDHRQPDYFKTLMTYIKTHDLMDSFRILGLIPRADVIWLMQHSLSLLNPSFFEGWSTTVEEAKSLGKGSILSDIPVHREQNPPDGVFFDPKNPTELAEVMWGVWSKRDLESAKRPLQQTQEELHRKRCEFAKRYEDIVLSLIK